MISNLSPQAFKEKLEEPQKYQLVDVRTPEEVAAGTILTPIVMDIYQDSFPEKVAELDPNLPTLVYCRGGVRSMSACKYMEKLGFKELYNLSTGVSGWPYELV
ncbi:MAG: rhodanese-like domain-containing protein [Luteibaculaceae bacterium]